MIDLIALQLVIMNGICTNRYSNISMLVDISREITYELEFRKMVLDSFRKEILYGKPLTIDDITTIL